MHLPAAVKARHAFQRGQLLNSLNTGFWASVYAKFLLLCWYATGDAPTGRMLSHEMAYFAPNSNLETYFSKESFSDAVIEIIEEDAQPGDKRKRPLTLPGHSMVLIAFSGYCRVKVSLSWHLIDSAALTFTTCPAPHPASYDTLMTSTAGCLHRTVITVCSV